MEFEEDIERLDKKMENVGKKLDNISPAWEMIQDNKKSNKRMFIIIMTILIMWFLTIGYLVYILNDIGTVDSDSIDIQDVESIDNSHIKIGDDVWEKSK